MKKKKKKKKNNQRFLSENIYVLEVEFSIFLNRHVFVMRDCGISYLSPYFVLPFTHFRRNSSPDPHPHSSTLYIGDVKFQFMNVRLCDLDIRFEVWLNCLQTVETLISHHILRDLIVWQLPICGSTY